MTSFLWRSLSSVCSPASSSVTKVARSSTFPSPNAGSDMVRPRHWNDHGMVILSSQDSCKYHLYRYILIIWLGSVLLHAFHPETRFYKYYYLNLLKISNSQKQKYPTIICQGNIILAKIFQFFFYLKLPNKQIQSGGRPWKAIYPQFGGFNYLQCYLLKLVNIVNSNWSALLKNMVVTSCFNLPFNSINTICAIHWLMC